MQSHEQFHYNVSQVTVDQAVDLLWTHVRRWILEYIKSFDYGLFSQAFDLNNIFSDLRTDKQKSWVLSIQAGVTCLPRQLASLSRSYTMLAFSLCCATCESWPGSAKYGKMLTMIFGKQSASKCLQSLSRDLPIDFTCSKSSRKTRRGISTG